MKNILDRRKDGRTEVKQYNPPPVEWGYNDLHYSRSKDWKVQIIQSSESKKTKGLRQDSQID